jgi:glycosyltransferase involved in cell wall biosynthesis
VRLEHRDIVCVGFADWQTELRTNQHHLMSRLARTNKVLFVESLGLRQPQLSGRDLRRMAQRFRRGVAPPRVIDGVHVLSPLVVPLHRYAAVRALNARLLPFLVGRAAKRLGMSSPILWSYNPQAEVLIDVLEPSLVLYHCVDDIAAQKGVDGASFRAAEERFVRRADAVLTTSEPLAERLRAISDKVHAMPNVADTELFSHALGEGRVDPALEALPGPRIVFTGAIVATKLDLDLLTALAQRRRDWSFALVGPVGAGDPSTDVSRLGREPNVHLLGHRPYEALPDVLRGADAALIPYSLNELTASIFPMKVYEYLAAGLPVVATPLPSLRGVEGIATAADAESTAARLEELLAADTPEARAERSRLASGHSWDARVDEIAAVLNGHG